MSFTRLKEKRSVYLYTDFTISTLLVCVPFVLKRNPRVKASRFRNTKLIVMVQSVNKPYGLPMVHTLIVLAEMYKYSYI